MKFDVSDNVVRLAAILGLIILEVIKLATLQFDGNLLLTIGAAIGGIAGYQIRLMREKALAKKKREGKESES